MDFHKNDVRSVSLVLLAFSMIMGTAFSSDAFAQSSGMTINVNADEGSSTISVSGRTLLSNDVTIVVTAPNGNKVTIDQVSPNLNGEYMTDIQIGSLWKQDGLYTVSVQQSNSPFYSLSVQVEISGGSAMATSASDSSLEFNASIIASPSKDVRGLTFTADATPGALIIGIDGHTDHTNTDITLVVNAPNGNIMSVDQITPDQNGDFSTVIGVGCPAWKQNGDYTITVQQGENNFYSDSVDVEIKDCLVVPEFGTIAALVLAVAIISIVVVSARSRLSIMPKY